MGLKENLQNEPVTRLDIRQPVITREDVSLREAVTAMRKQNIGCAIVVNDEQNPIGIFTESMLTELLSLGPVAFDKPIKNFMAERCPWTTTADPISDVLDAMQLKNIRLLCVVDENKKVVGLTGQRGLMEYVAEHFPGQVTVQRIGQPPYLSDREGA